VPAAWQLIVLRFLMGLVLNGLCPVSPASSTTTFPLGSPGRSFGYATPSQYVGQAVGPLLGGFVGVPAVFLGTSELIACGSASYWLVRPNASD
jgi:MFS family permease